MTTVEIYKQALNDILNSKSKDVAVLRKIALTAFTKPIKEIADCSPLNWYQNSEPGLWYLEVNEVGIACLSEEETERGNKWVLMDYDDQFSNIFTGGTLPEFDHIEEGKKYVELRFLTWLKDASELLKTN